MTRTRQVLFVILVLFIVYAIYTNPAKSADAVRAIWNFLVSAFNAVLSFFSHLING